MPYFFGASLIAEIKINFKKKYWFDMEEGSHH
jgi:hypothetical protein